ncbi:hypothetical protein [Gelidibacter japonicus]|uniref:hypothetical protein n=1 Tax=Gelidibacter japonicus TaxID=1962232 RepID=UPI002AFEF9B5|nr:hypothetical protein [Gelidibacter japonicus]
MKRLNAISVASIAYNPTYNLDRVQYLFARNAQPIPTPFRKSSITGNALPLKSWTLSPISTFHFANPFRCAGTGRFIPNPKL